MGYGTPVKEKKLPLVGVQEDCTIVGDQLFLLEDKNGNLSASITFGQTNGSTVQQRVFDSDTEDGQADTNAWIHHVCTKIVPTEEYEAAVAPSTGFADFINRVNQVTAGAYQGKKYRMLFHYNKKGYVTTPRYAPFIEEMGKVNSISAFLNSNSKSAAYVRNLLTRPEQPQPDAEQPVTQGESDDLPF